MAGSAVLVLGKPRHVTVVAGGYGPCTAGLAGVGRSRGVGVCFGAVRGKCGRSLARVTGPAWCVARWCVCSSLGRVWWRLEPFLRCWTGLSHFRERGAAWGGVGRCRATWSGVGRCRAAWGGVERCGAAWSEFGVTLAGLYEVERCCAGLGGLRLCRAGTGESGGVGPASGGCGVFAVRSGMIRQVTAREGGAAGEA
jgi:hypothetical protein